MKTPINGINPPPLPIQPEPSSGFWTPERIRWFAAKEYIFLGFGIILGRFIFPSINREYHPDPLLMMFIYIITLVVLLAGFVLSWIARWKLKEINVE